MSNERSVMESAFRYHVRVRRSLLRIITAIQLTRLTMAFGAVADVWFVILLTKYHDSHSIYAYLPVHDMNLAAALFAGATVAIGLFAYGASLNDILDVRHDTAFSPERPIPAGRIRLGQAIVVTVGALIVAMLGSMAMGKEAGIVAVITAAIVLFYNATGKYIPAVGLTTVGVIHAAHMLIPNYQLEFTLPVWLVMTHSMVIAAIVHRLEDKRPVLSPRSIGASLAGWGALTTLLIWAGARHGEGLWPDSSAALAALYPIMAAVGFVFVAWWKATGVRGKAAAEKLKRYSAMWEGVYGAAWLLALNMPAQAVWLALFSVAGFAAMTAIKEVTGLSDRPVAYR
ncbi:MAG TPA: UbiA family prenyltransferase [Phycisphaerales bacterium]|nr:UbiA family prenyltransferase [Phycisphaerales bacterium]